MKINPTVAKLLGNKTVLYVVSIVSLLNVLGYLFYGNITAVVYFALFGLLVSYFSKNMIIILLVPLILVNLLVGAQQQNMKNVEGMTTNTESTNSSGATNTNGTKNTSTPSTTTTTPSTTTTTPSTTSASNTTTLANTSAATTPITPLTDSFTSNKGKRGKHNVDYATTISEAYDNLNSVLGSEGIKSLTQDTKRLMQQQQDLASSMKDIVPLVQSFEPMMERAKGLLDSMGGLDNIKGLDGIKDIFGKLGNSEKNKNQ